jgi:hypothetical protein
MYPPFFTDRPSRRGGIGRPKFFTLYYTTFSPIYQGEFENFFSCGGRKLQMGGAGGDFTGT